MSTQSTHCILERKILKETVMPTSPAPRSPIDILYSSYDQHYNELDIEQNPPRTNWLWPSAIATSSTGRKQV